MTIKIIKAVNLQPLMCFIFILFSYSFFYIYIYIYCTSDFNTGVTHAFRNSIRLLEEICAPRGFSRPPVREEMMEVQLSPLVLIFLFLWGIKQIAK